MRILITGAGGFIGKRLSSALASNGCDVRTVLRGQSPEALAGVFDFISINDIATFDGWSDVLRDVDVIVHLASLVSLNNDRSGNALNDYRRVNVEGTRRMAEAAMLTGVRLIVYISTIKVNGEFTSDKPFTEFDVPSPGDAYSLSKWEAEQALNDFRANMEITIIRPPMVYGPGAKGNLVRLMKSIEKGYPLPFKNIRNKRSLISIDNLIDVIIASVFKAESAGNTFLVSDGDDISTPDLISRIAISMGKKPRLVDFPEKTMAVISNLVPPIRPLLQRLTGSLVIDSGSSRNRLNWVPRGTVDEGIRSMVSAYLSGKSSNVD
jgi:nucleoside-diphosphate-sugar epimerase